MGKEQKFVGLTFTTATKMNLHEAERIFGRDPDQLPQGMQEAVPGYLVQGFGTGPAFLSEEAFGRFYRPSNGMTFGHAIEALKRGFKVRRAAWKHRDFFYLVPGSKFPVSRAPLLGIYPEGTEINYQAHIDQRKTSGECGVADINQADILAEDWEIVE